MYQGTFSSTYISYSAAVYLSVLFVCRPNSWEETALGFYHAISWEEDIWLFTGILCFHLFCYAITFFTRTWPNTQIGLLLLFAALVYNTETINAVGHLTWRRFASQNYFDERGNCFIQVSRS